TADADDLRATVETLRRETRRARDGLGDAVVRQLADVFRGDGFHDRVRLALVGDRILQRAAESGDDHFRRFRLRCRAGCLCLHAARSTQQHGVCEQLLRRTRGASDSACQLSAVETLHLTTPVCFLQRCGRAADNRCVRQDARVLARTTPALRLPKLSGDRRTAASVRTMLCIRIHLMQHASELLEPGFVIKSTVAPRRSNEYACIHCCVPDARLYTKPSASPRERMSRDGRTSKCNCGWSSVRPAAFVRRTPSWPRA